MSHGVTKRKAKAQAPQLGGVGHAPGGRRFYGVVHGGIVEPLQGLNLEALRDCLPKGLRTHPHVEAFLADVADCAACVLDMAQDVPMMTPGDIRNTLIQIEDEAHRMQNELQSLTRASDVFECLDVDFRYLRQRAGDARAVGPRPAVPSLPADVPNLPQLLARIDSDLQTLRAACAHTAGKIRPARSTPKHHERMLVREIAALYRAHFGVAPPKRGLFADALIPAVAQAMKMDIGHRVVGEEVENLT